MKTKSTTVVSQLLLLLRLCERTHPAGLHTLQAPHPAGPTPYRPHTLQAPHPAGLHTLQAPHPAGPAPCCHLVYYEIHQLLQHVSFNMSGRGSFNPFLWRHTEKGVVLCFAVRIRVPSALASYSCLFTLGSHLRTSSYLPQRAERTQVPPVVQGLQPTVIVHRGAA